MESPQINTSFALVDHHDYKRQDGEIDVAIAWANREFAGGVWPNNELQSCSQKYNALVRVLQQTPVRGGVTSIGQYSKESHGRKSTSWTWGWLTGEDEISGSNGRTWSVTTMVHVELAKSQLICHGEGYKRNTLEVHTHADAPQVPPRVRGIPLWQRTSDKTWKLVLFEWAPVRRGNSHRNPYVKVLRGCNGCNGCISHEI